MHEIEQSIDDIVIALQSGTIPNNISHIHDKIKRIEETVKHNSEDVLNLQSAQKKSTSESQSQIHLLEEQVTLVSSELQCKVNTSANAPPIMMCASTPQGIFK